MKNTLIDRDIIRNHIDTIILHLLFEKDRYGYELFKEVPARTNGAYELALCQDR
jgi:PadR family transcriptional regulator PadR